MVCIDKVRGWIDANRLIAPREKVLVAVSGGPDSMALLVMLAELSRERGFELAVAHFDHGIRPEAPRETALVERRAKALGLTLFRGSGDVPREARRMKQGIEETARSLRYAFLEETADAWKADRIALGHTRDDQIETILHHIIRGTGWRGLRGMAPRRERFIRPLLPCGRRELVTYLRRRGVRYAVDRSNEDPRFLRNRIRTRLLPFLRTQFNPAIDEAILRLGENLAGGWETLERPLAGLIPPRSAAAGLRIPLRQLRSLSEFEVYLLVDMVLREKFAVARDVEKKHFDAVKRLIDSPRSGRRIPLPHGIVVLREQSSIFFARAAAPEPGPVEVVIAGTGSYPLPSWGLTVRIEPVTVAGTEHVSRRRELFTASVRFPLRVRARRPGDRVIPFGMRGRRKLSDCFIDRKIPLSIRDRIPVFEDRDGILWVPGVVASERTRIGPRARRLLRIRLSGSGREK
jgi:tRNA(Ile)-lysidine synthase